MDVETYSERTILSYREREEGEEVISCRIEFSLSILGARGERE